MPVSRYVALRTVKHSGQDFPPGTPMALSDAYADPLLAVQAIEPQAGALPAMPAVVGDVVRDSIDTASGDPAEVALKARISSGGVANWDVSALSIAGHVVYSALPKLNGHIPADGRTYSISAFPELAKRLSRISNGLGAFSSRTSAVDNAWYSVCWSSELSLFVAVALSGSGNRVMTSPDGITWTARTSAADNAWRGVCWSPELRLFVAIAETGSGNRVMTSPDGITWTARTSAVDNGWYSVCWSSALRLFVAVALSGSGNRVMTSPDGITWTARTSAADNNWRGVCWSPELSLFVAVSESGAGSLVMTAYGCTYNPLTDFAVPKITAPAGCYAHIFAG